MGQTLVFRSDAVQLRVFTGVSVPSCALYSVYTGPQKRFKHGEANIPPPDFPAVKVTNVWFLTFALTTPTLASLRIRELF